MASKRTIPFEEFDALQYDGDNVEEVKTFLGLEVKINQDDLIVLDPSGDWNIFKYQWVLKTLEGEVLGSVDKDHFWENFATIDELVD